MVHVNSLPMSCFAACLGCSLRHLLGLHICQFFLPVLRPVDLAKTTANKQGSIFACASGRQVPAFSSHIQASCCWCDSLPALHIGTLRLKDTSMKHNSAGHSSSSECLL